MRVWEWIKRNKLATFLLVLLLLILGKGWFSNLFIGRSAIRMSSPRKRMELSQPEELGLGMTLPREKYLPPPSRDYPPSPEVKDRLVIQQSYLSLLVKNVRETVDKILDFSKTSGGYMVSSSLQFPEETPSATVTIRLPANNLKTALEFFRSLSVKVVSENLTGKDVTDQYVDIEARLTTLYKTKAKFEGILEKAQRVEEILKVQREIINLQSKIDSLKGQKQYLEKSAQMAKVTIYLSTDEIALPYTPSEAWRPNVIFKLAVRSLVKNIRSLGTILIWILVYSLIWIPLAILAVIIKKRTRKNGVMKKFPASSD